MSRSNENLTQDPTTESGGIPPLVKKNRKITYVVQIHFSKISKETMSGKIKCMLKNTIQQMRKNNNCTESDIRKRPVPSCQ
ncbi:MAG: hypothetical protein HDQ99_21000 [Lachnospiraceae bacterium]|nr:hypothetical protein [Lachnospiraceae bacterium]